MPTPSAITEPAPWRDRRFVLFAAGNFANNLGEGTYKVALPLYAYSLTGSLTVMSLLAALSPVMLLISPWVGAIADRWGPRVCVVPGLLVQLAAAVGLNLVALGGRPGTPALFVLAALIQFGGEVYRTGWIAGVPQMFPRSPGRSRAVLSSLFVTSNVIGPLMVAAGLGVLGYVGLLWLNAATFVAPIVVWLIGIHPPAKEIEPDAAAGGYLRDIVAGWRVVRAEKRALYVQVAALPLQFVSGVGLLAFLVWYLREHWEVSASTVGVAQAVANVGALSGSLYVASRARTSPRLVLGVSAVVMTAALLGMASPSIIAFFACMVLFFTQRSAMTAVTALVIVKYLPAEVVGRAEGLFNLLGGIPILLAPLLIPVVQAGFGGTSVLIFLGIVAGLSIVLMAVFTPGWRAAEHSHDQRDPVPNAELGEH